MTFSSPRVATAAAEQSRRWSTRVLMVVATLFAAVAGGVLHAPAAAGHGGDYELTVTPDGAGGLQVLAHYVDDGHIVDALMDLEAEGVSADGTTAGPVSLVSSSEGQGRWITEEPFLDDSDWTVTVTTTTPSEASTVVEFTVEPLEPPVEPEPADEPDSADGANPEGDSAQQASTGGIGGVGGVPVAWLIVALIAVALVAGTALAWRRKRS